MGKNFFYLSVSWIILILLPLKFLPFMFGNDGGIILLYSLFMPLLFSVIIFSYSKSKKEKMLYSVIAIILLVIFYIYIYNEIKAGFNLSF